MDEWLLGRIVAAGVGELGLTELSSGRLVDIIRILVSHQRWFEGLSGSQAAASDVLVTLLQDRDVRRFLRVNRHGGALWFHHESFQELIGWLLVPAVIDAVWAWSGTLRGIDNAVAARYLVLEQLALAERQSGYQLERLVERTRGPGPLP
jgi:hypothetical protein